MEKLSGLVLDIYDDKDGDVLRQVFGTEELPESVKQASALDLDTLPDDLFALVLHDRDVTLRKYACADSSHTALSVGYFMKTGHKLPREAQKVAAQNLVTACGWYNMEVPEELQKVALGLGSLMSTALIAPGAAREAKANLTATRGAGGSVLTSEQIKMLRGQQMAGGV